MSSKLNFGICEIKIKQFIMKHCFFSLRQSSGRSTLNDTKWSENRAYMYNNSGFIPIDADTYCVYYIVLNTIIGLSSLIIIKY